LDPKIKIIAIDPLGSVLATDEELNKLSAAEGGQIVEGIGYDFIPRVLDRSCTDEWMKAADKETFVMARRLMREEGMMCGGSSGTAMWGALEYNK
jgi:cystathionine beta-synthase